MPPELATPGAMAEVRIMACREYEESPTPPMGNVRLGNFSENCALQGCD